MERASGGLLSVQPRPPASICRINRPQAQRAVLRQRRQRSPPGGTGSSASTGGLLGDRSYEHKFSSGAGSQTGPALGADRRVDPNRSTNPSSTHMQGNRPISDRGDSVHQPSNARSEPRCHRRPIPNSQPASQPQQRALDSKDLPRGFGIDPPPYYSCYLHSHCTFYIVQTDFGLYGLCHIGISIYLFLSAPASPAAFPAIAFPRASVRWCRSCAGAVARSITLLQPMTAHTRR